MGNLLVVACEGLSDRELAQLVREIQGHEFVHEVLACSDEQARDVRRAIDW